MKLFHSSKTNGTKEVTKDNRGKEDRRKEEEQKQQQQQQQQQKKKEQSPRRSKLSWSSLGKKTEGGNGGTVSRVSGAFAMAKNKNKDKKDRTSSHSSAVNNNNNTTSTNNNNSNNNKAKGNNSKNKNQNKNHNTNMTVFRVTVPEDIQPGEEFQVYAGSRIVRVRCPNDSRPGQSLQITVPADTTNTTTTNNNNNNTNGTGSDGGGGALDGDTTTTTRGRTSNNSNSNNNNNTSSSFSSEQQQQQQRASSLTTSSSAAAAAAPPSLQSHQSLGSTVSTAEDSSPDVRRIRESDPPAYMVSVPSGVEPGTQFPVTIRGQQLMVTCPLNARPSMSVRIVPPPLLPPIINNSTTHNSTTNSSSTDFHASPSPASLPPTQLRQTVSTFSGTTGTTATTSSSTTSTELSQSTQPQQQQPQRPRPHPSHPPPEKEKTQLFEVEVPRGVQPGAPFALLAGGVRVLVTCPANAGPGQRIRFKLPLALTQATQQQHADNQNGDLADQQHNELQQIKLKYDKDGWTRTVRATDLKFQWIRMDGAGNIDVLGQRFHMEKSAYVRRLEFRPGADPRLRDGLLRLVPATDSVVDSKIKAADGRDLVTYSDLARAQMKNFDQKAQWFQDTCATLCVEWNEGHMRMNIRRSHLLGDSVDAVMSLSRKDLRKLWRFEFIGELGIDAGGLAREWFELVCSEVFDPDMGLWMSSTTNQMSMTINPASEYCCEDHLIYYRFLGRIMGKALFDRQLVRGHMVKHLYKHILGWPIYFKDLESVDEEYYNNLKQLSAMHDRGEDLSMLCLDFTMTSDIMGIRKEMELVPGGADIEVTNDNFMDYVEACLKYKLMGSVQPQLNELLLGFFDVIPEPLLTIFDYQELELIMCGLPHIDLDDWKTHTEYSGEFEEFGIHHPKVEWFWDTLEEDFNDELRARLLLFVTGTSGVPSRGFGVLQSNDGNIRNFTIHGVSADICFYPRAHTCFNRIDLPLYDSKEQLQERLKLAVTMSATGFDIE